MVEEMKKGMKLRRTLRNKSKKRSGGAAIVMPLQYYNPGASEPSANAGRDLLKAIPPIGVRPRIGGGKRKPTRKMNKSRKSKGGFVPSVMGGFVEAASKYITPLVLFAGYKMLTKKQKSKRSHSTRRH